jgi:hypothetical protein
MRKLKPLLFVVIVLVLMISSWQPAQAILYRHDIDADAFLIDRADFPAVFEVVPGNGGATLIAPQWAVTAAHVTQLIERDDSHTVTIDDGEYKIIEVVTHPQWEGIHFNDIALLKLDRPVNNILPLPMYENEDEQGQQVLILGSGDHATGLEGARNAARDGQFRGVTNMVERIELGSFWVQFDAPGSAKVTDFEGVAGPGDSGGPAFIKVDGSYYLVGVASFGIEMGDPPPAPGTYGSFDTYTSISRNRAWIDAILNGEPIIEVTPDAPQVEVIIEPDEPARNFIEPEEASIETKSGQLTMTWPGFIGALLGAVLLGSFIGYFVTVRGKRAG